MSELALAIGDYPHTASLHREDVRLGNAGALRVDSLRDIGGFAALLDRFEHDFFEYPIVSFLVARAHEIPIRALPVFVTRGFMHDRLYRNTTLLADPATLEGQRFGLQYHGYTDGTWGRGLVTDHFGIDPDKVTWVTSAPERLESVVLPPNVVQLPGRSFPELLEKGELAALFATNGEPVPEGPTVASLFSDPRGAAIEWFAATGVLPILHTVVVKESVLERHPGLVNELVERLYELRAPVLERVAAGAPRDDAERELVERAEIAGDPLPYGIEANRAALEMILRFSLEQRVVERAAPIDELFVGAK